MIIKKIIILFLTFPLFIFAQNKTTDQSIELPDFVITGVEKISIIALKKHRPKFIPLLKNKFFKPFTLPGNISLSSFSNPKPVKIVIDKKEIYYNGQLEVGAGIYSQPAGKFNYHINKGHTHVYANISGINVTDYDPGSEYNNTKFKFGSEFDISRNSQFLSGSTISVEGNYEREQYNLYASSVPNLERKNQFTYGSLKINNFYSKRFNYLLSGKVINTKFQENDLQETTIKSNAQFNFNWESIALQTFGTFSTQNLKNSLITSNDNFAYTGKFLLVFNLLDGLEAKIGGIYSRQDTNILVRPILNLTAKLDEGVTLIGKYEPSTNFETINDFLNFNRYLKNINFNNLLLMNETNLSFAVRYQDYKYFEINGGINFRISENYPYFEGELFPSDFELKSSDYVKKAEAFFNLLFYKGPYGKFFGNVNLRSIKFRDGNFVPYEPVIKADLSYGYEINNSLSLNIVLKYYSKSYTDRNNINEIPEYIRIGSALKYSFSQSVKFFVQFDNLLNRDNFIYMGYKEKPFDILGGVNYSW